MAELPTALTGGLEIPADAANPSALHSRAKVAVMAAMSTKSREGHLRRPDRRWRTEGPPMRVKSLVD
jgi:hypothetical protein